MEHQLKLIVRLLVIIAKLVAVLTFQRGIACDKPLCDLWIQDIERIRAEAEEIEEVK